MWVFVAAVLLGFSALLWIGIFGAIAAGELHQYSKRAGFLVHVAAVDASSYWLELGALALVALFLLGAGSFAVRAYITLGRES